MSRPTSALSDLIRQATSSEVTESLVTSLPASIRRTDVPQPAQHTASQHATAEELTEAFFPGSSLRGHSFFPKSLTTHSQASFTRSQGFLGSARANPWGHTDGNQVTGSSPPFGSLRGASGGGAGGVASTGTSHSFLHRQASTAHASIAEVDTEGCCGGDGGCDDPDAASASAAASAAAGGGSGSGRRHSGQGSAPLHYVGGFGAAGASPGMSGGAGGGGGGGGGAAASGSWQAPWSRGGRSPATPADGASLLAHAHSQSGQPGAGLYGSSFQGPQSLFVVQPHLGLQPRPSGGQPPPPQPPPPQPPPPAAVHHAPRDELLEPLLLHEGYGGAAAAAEAGAAAPAGPGAEAAARHPSADAAAAAATAGVAEAAPAGPAAEAEAEAALAAHRRRRSSFFNAVVFGMINAVVSMPTLIAYCAIVFKAPLYKPYLDSLCRFFFFSSAVHQFVFVGLSTLPFAIGQVQDVGLIFLSAMASDIALRLAGPGGKHASEAVAEMALGSSLVVMTVSTFVVGLMTVIVARLKLADLVSYVPLPVVGGYLGFVGYFCIAGGTALAAGVQVDTLPSWASLFAVDPLLKLLPGAATIAALMATVAHVEHPLALPGLLTAVPAAFHGVLWWRGWSLGDAQAAGWVMPPTVGDASFWRLWGMFNLYPGQGGVSLPAILAQAPKVAGLFLVVCFGSCMDVAAIQSDMPEPLDFNRELLTVGVSNMATAALGAGYTGSYIFSQTVFTMRQGVFNRINGLVVAIVEITVFALPFSVVQYLPNFYFGALLVWFGIEISKDWLILSYRKLSRAEYVLLWGSFLSIMLWGLELGIAAGVVLATLYFAFQYAQSQVSSLRRVAARSGRTHLAATSSSLELLGRRLAVLRLSGFVFFGSSSGLSAQILHTAARMLQERAEEQQQHEAWAMSAESGGGGDYGATGGGGGRQEHPTLPITVPPPAVSASAPAVLEPPSPPPAVIAAAAAADAAAGGGGGGSPQSRKATAVPPTDDDGGGGGGGAAAAADDALSSAEWHWRAAAALSEAPVVLILDLSAVTGLDSTAARTFATLISTLASQRVVVLFSGLRPSGGVRQLLEANGLPLRPFVGGGGVGSAAGGGGGGGSPRAAAATADGGGGGGSGGAKEGVAEMAARMVAESAIVRPPAGGCWEFGGVAAAVRAAEDGYLGLALGCGLLPEAPSAAASLTHLLAGHLREVLPSAPQLADLGSLVSVLEGCLSRRRLALGDVLYAGGAAVREVYVIEQGSLVEEEHFEGGLRVGSREHGAGVVVGSPEFFLSRPAPATLRCSSPAAHLLVLGRPALAHLLAAHPAALAALELLLLRAACMDLASAREAANTAA